MAIDLSERAEVNWGEYLTSFNEQVWPIFRRAGFSRDTAAILWFLNKSHNLMVEFHDCDHHEKECTSGDA